MCRATWEDLLNTHDKDDAIGYCRRSIVVIVAVVVVLVATRYRTSGRLYCDERRCCTSDHIEEKKKSNHELFIICHKHRTLVSLSSSRGVQ